MLHQILIGPYAKDKCSGARCLTMLTNCLFKGPWNTNWTLGLKILIHSDSHLLPIAASPETMRTAWRKLVCTGKSGSVHCTIRTGPHQQLPQNWLQGCRRKKNSGAKRQHRTAVWTRKVKSTSIDLYNIKPKWLSVSKGWLMSPNSQTLIPQLCFSSVLWCFTTCCAVGSRAAVGKFC